jgi:hypothetical protein
VKTSILAKTTLTLALLSVMSTAGIKYVAVVESDIDESSGASEKISRADVRLVTAELRREAVKNLPPKRYVIMTAETVMAQGGAVLEECADENCVITLGSKIGADYIVRGTVSKLESKFTLQVEMYETENGNLVASCDPVRSESIGELVERAATACANMYKAWLASQNLPDEVADGDAKKLSNFSIGGGAFFANNVGGGLKWPSGEAVAMPYVEGGVYLFLEYVKYHIVNIDIFIGYGEGGGYWKSAAAPSKDDLPYMSRASINIGNYYSLPIISTKRLRFFPIIGVEANIAIIGAEQLEYKADATKYKIENDDGFADAWAKGGGGMDFKINNNIYLRGEMLYGIKLVSGFEEDYVVNEVNRYPFTSTGVKSMLGSGVTVRIGAYLKLNKPNNF